jgi:hypothetical protein
MTDRKTLKYTPIPALCEDCGRELLTNAANEKGQKLLWQFCPHNWTLAQAALVQHEGELAIGGWVFQGPVDEAGALELIEEERQRLDMDAVVYHGSRRLN